MRELLRILDFRFWIVDYVKHEKPYNLKSEIRNPQYVQSAESFLR